MKQLTRAAFGRARHFLKTQARPLDRALFEHRRKNGGFKTRAELAGVAGISDDTRRWILRGVDFKLRHGEWLAVTGPTGAGKTTTVRIIMGTLSPDQGSVRIMGLDSVADRPRAMSSSIRRRQPRELANIR